MLKKIQLTSSSASGLRDLQEVFQSPSRVSFDFVVLGCCSAVRFRGLSNKETDRVAAARRVSLLLGLLRLGFEHSSVALRSFAINKMAYGWVSRLPTVVVSWGQWAVVRFSQGVFSATNKFLRAMMFGGLLHPDCVIGVTLLRLVFKARLGGGVWCDHPRRGSLLRNLMGWFDKIDVQLIRSWVWSAGHPQTQIDLNFNDGFDIAAHRLRNAWRLYQ